MPLSIINRRHKNGVGTSRMLALAGDQFKVNDSGLFEPSGFAKEIKYLRDNGIKRVYYIDGNSISLDDIDLDNILLDWETNWRY